ncbi:MGMT family protein [Psychrobacillus antarcticus]|uniref:MGMT family protein n=1 Tax=Psychrobacillus antarcticus TaxID=2879115 RepID=UPI002408055D|nr:MGMT family protein [Psychrobacillus antarcticus]
MNPFTERVIQIIKSIPSGKVMTYGQIAKVAGSPRGARQVVRVLHSMSAKYNLPWHRVINAKGEIVIADEESAYSQKAILEAEGVQFLTGDRVDLRKSLYDLQVVEEEWI